MTELKGQSLSPKTKWPDAAPLDGEEFIFSISCGNSHLHWATHYGDAEDYNPQIFWRTPHLKEEDLDKEELLAILSRNLPDDPHDHIFGKSRDATVADGVSQSKKRAAPLISVYVVSTNRAQEELLAKIWKTVPSRFFVMRGEDFFKKEEGRYDTMGTDRLATLTGAVHLHGHPALVFDGGTATTYSATDSGGKIMGGGIGPGIASKFRSLTKDTDALPEITTEEVIARVNEAQTKGKPLPTFARNTQEAMMADAFQEFALKGRNVIEHWLQKAYSNSAVHPAETTRKVNTDKRVICTGGDGDILMQLLQPHYGGVIEHMESNDGTKSKNSALGPTYIVEASKHLIHYGIACALAVQVSLRKSKDEFSKNPHKEHVGKRVAKHFEVEADDGDNIYRGKVMEVVEAEGSELTFRIKYDDGDSEDISTSELFDMFKLFSSYGEKKSEKAAPAKGKKKPAVKKPKKAKSSVEAIDIQGLPAKSAENKENGAPAEKKEPNAKKSKKAISSGVEKAVDIPSVKSVKNKANGAPAGEKESNAKKAKKAKSSDVEKAVDIPSVKSAKNKANGAPAGEKESNAKTAKKASSSDVEKAVDTPIFPVKSAKNKANGAPVEEKKPDAKTAKKATSPVKSAKSTADGAPAGEKESNAKKAKKASSLDVEKAVDIPIFPVKSAKSKDNGAPAEEKKPDAKKANKATSPDDVKAVGAAIEEEKQDAKKANKAKPSDDEKAVNTPSPLAKSAKKKANRTLSLQGRKPAAKKVKKTKTVNNILALVNGSNPRSFVRRRVAKAFGSETYFGTIMEYDDAENPAYWHVEYDDGDEEDYAKKDLIKALKLYEIKGKKDSNKTDQKS